MFSVPMFESDAEEWFDQAFVSVVTALQHACVYQAACCLAVLFLHTGRDHDVGSSSTCAHLSVRGESNIQFLCICMLPQMSDSMI